MSVQRDCWRERITQGQLETMQENLRLLRRDPDLDKSLLDADWRNSVDQADRALQCLLDRLFDFLKENDDE